VADAFGFAAAFYGIIPAYGVAAALVLFSRRIQPEPSPASLSGAARPSAWQRAHSFGAVLLDPVVIFVILGAFFLNVFLSQFQTFLPLTLLPLGISLTEVGGLRSAWSMTNALGRIFGGPVLGVMDYRRTQNLCLLCQATLLAVFAFPLPLAIYGIITVGAASGRAVCYVANAVALSEVDPNRIGRGVASGIMNAAGDLGNILGPVSGGFIAAAAGYQKFWLISPPLYLAIYFGVLQLVRRRSSVQAVPAAV
jgi:predicted MFS family arabinose efflux permease